MVSDFPKMPTNRIRWRLPFLKLYRRSVPLGQYKRDWKRKFLQMVRKFPMEIPFGNCGVSLEVLHDFRTEFSENYVIIRFQTEISGFFGQMVSTPGCFPRRARALHVVHVCYTCRMTLKFWLRFLMRVLGRF